MSLPDDLLARLAAVGGAWTGAGPSPWGSYEILTPAHAAEKLIWCTPAALADLLDEWEAIGGWHPCLAVVLQLFGQQAAGHADPPGATLGQVGESAQAE